MAIYDFFVSRNGAVANAASYIGHAGRLFYDSDNGVIRLSDGVTPGGTFIPYNIATATTIGGIKAGPGANIAVDGTLTIDTTGLPLGIGNLQVVDTTLKTVNPNEDLIVESNGTGNVSLVGNVLFHPTNGPTLADPYFVASSDGQITIYTPASDPTSGAVKIIGTASGSFSMPVNTGVMLQLTGNNNDASRLYNDSVGSFAAFVGRRVNGTVASPSAVQAGDEIIRISSTGYNGNAIPGAGSARIVYQAKENYTTTAQGSNISIWATQLGTTTLSKIVTVDYESGLTATKANVVGNLTVGGAVVSNLTVTGTITTPRTVIASTGIRTILGGIYANLSFATDSIVHLYQPTGDVIVNINGHTAGATIRLLINMATARAVTLGVSANNSTIGAAQLLSNKIVNNQAVQIVYTCIDGTSGNTHAAVSYV